MPSQGAISSLAYSSGAVATAASTSYLFGPPKVTKKHIKSIRLYNPNNNLSMPFLTTTTTTTSSYSETNVSPKSPLKRFKLFRKSKRSKVSSTTAFVFPPKPMFQAVHPEQEQVVVVEEEEDDDNTSSVYSDVFKVNDDRRTLSVPNLPAALQRTQPWDTSPTASGVFVPRVVTETLHEEDEEDEDWDSQSDSTKTLSPSLVVSNPSRRRHSRCNSLPPPNIHDFSPSLFHRQPTPSESWDDDFDLDVNELNVPSRVEETQVSLRMDISNIKDFATHIRELKDLRDKKENLYSSIQSKMTRKWTNGFLSMTYNKVKILETFYKRDWEEANVIIDVADVADDKTPFGENVEVDIERIPSKRHMKILERIIVKGLGEDAKDFLFFDNDKENENQQDYDIPTKKQKLMSFCTNDNKISNNEKRRRENLSMFVEVMPSLVDHLKELQCRLTRHVNELALIN